MTKLTIDFNMIRGIGIGLVLGGLFSGFFREDMTLVAIGLVLVVLAYWLRAEQRNEELKAEGVKSA